MATKSKLSEGAQNCLNALREGMKTAKEMKESGMEVNSAHLTVLVSRGLATATKETFECVCCGAKRKANSYEITQKGVDYTGE